MPNEISSQSLPAYFYWLTGRQGPRLELLFPPTDFFTESEGTPGHTQFCPFDHAEDIKVWDSEFMVQWWNISLKTLSRPSQFKSRAVSGVGLKPRPPGETATSTQRLGPLGHPDAFDYFKKHLQVAEISFRCRMARLCHPRGARSRAVAPPHQEESDEVVNASK